MAAVAGAKADGALLNGIEVGLGDLSSLNEVLDRQAVDLDVVDQRDHGVTVATNAPAVDVSGVDVQLVGNVVAHTGRVQESSHTDNLVLGESSGLEEHLDHDVERVGDANDESVGGVLLDVLTDGGHDLAVRANEVVTAPLIVLLVRQPGQTGGNDAHVTVGNVFVLGGANDPLGGVVDGVGMHDVKGLGGTKSCKSIRGATT
ncbi:penicillin amidase, putative [Babesia ovata]|uniref:Penicillin amidase, putative n=1 Tax=Babesia ovata TaxID=189622 RepID=A0A2H6KB43_9APIC|nr:penicillin amidase, putative [Babesia ovata]GBE60208.1 penicillin amidase, putative [Babesia ovata]